MAFKIFYNWTNSIKRALVARELEEHNRNLNTKCRDLEFHNKRYLQRYLCLKNVMEQCPSPVQFQFHNTRKGIPVVVCIGGEGLDVRVYNINANPEALCLLRLIAVFEENQARIIRISGGARLGHGQLAIECWLNLCKQRNIQKATVQFVPLDQEEQRKLTSFFLRCGFVLSKHTGNTYLMEKTF